MENDGRENTQAEIPINLGDLEVGESKTIAAGLTAIRQSIKYVYGEMGIARGTQTLLKLNQKGGIDCQSCAWADPEKRTVAEFCENGAKALADEGTSRKLTAIFSPATASPSFRGNPTNGLTRRGESSSR